MVMKKIFLMALAASAMMSCSENEMLDNGGQQAEIKVGTMVKAGTKAVVTDNDNFKAFTLSAYAIDPSTDLSNGGGLGAAYMDKVNYTGTKGNWTGEGTYYWPLDETMEFFAYPTELKTAYSVAGTGYPVLSYTVGETAAAQTDLVVAHATEATMPNGGKLILTFKHILTRINFSYKPEDATYTYEITGIKINDVIGGAATYKFDNTVGSWELGATTATYDYPIAVSSTADGGFYALNNTENSSLMLLPQSVAGKTISVAYKTTKNGHTYFNKTKTVTLPAGSTWELGQNIRYKLTLPVGADAITVDTEVENVNETGSEHTAS